MKQMKYSISKFYELINYFVISGVHNIINLMSLDIGNSSLLYDSDKSYTTGIDIILCQL